MLEALHHYLSTKEGTIILYTDEEDSPLHLYEYHLVPSPGPSGLV